MVGAFDAVLKTARKCNVDMRTATCIVAINAWRSSRACVGCAQT